jgi:hypothetical protein
MVDDDCKAFDGKPTRSAVELSDLDWFAKVVADAELRESF